MMTGQVIAAAGGADKGKVRQRGCMILAEMPLYLAWPVQNGGLYGEKQFVSAEAAAIASW
jgi:hypothetical protein